MGLISLATLLIPQTGDKGLGYYKDGVAKAPMFGGSPGRDFIAATTFGGLKEGFSFKVRHKAPLFDRMQLDNQVWI